MICKSFSHNCLVVFVKLSRNAKSKLDELISEISKYFTLKKGDILFTGTPEGVAAVAPNDVLEGFLNDKSMFRINVK